MPDRIRHAVGIIALAAAYFLLGKIGLMFASLHASVSLVWPSSGLALAALLVGGTRLWPGVLIGAFLVNISVSGAVTASLCIAAGNTLEALVAVRLVERYAGGSDFLREVPKVFAFVFLAAFLSTAVSATIGTSSLIVEGLAPREQFGALWTNWWLGDTVGMLLITPLLLAWHGSRRSKWSWRLIPERILFKLAVVFYGLEIFSPAEYVNVLPLGSYPLAFAAVPILLWASFRLGFRTAMTGTLLLSIIALWGTMGGSGPLMGKGATDALVLVQIFTGVISVTILLVAATQFQLRQYRQQLERANTVLTEASLTDALTGAHNRRGFDQRLADELERAARYKQPLSLLLMDVDLFKQHNDLFGHIAGDEVLKSVVRLLQSQVRATDTVARQGGDEFAVLLPNTGSESAIMMAERFRVAIERASWPGKPVTVTVGAATLPPESTHGARLLALADQALYEAKEAGRNRVSQLVVPTH